MLLQLKILFRILLKNLKWVLLFFIIATLYFIFLTVNSTITPITSISLIPFIGYPIKTLDSLGLLLIIYQSVVLIYIVYSFIYYDFSYSFENIILRINSKKWLLIKTILTYLLVIFIRVSLFLATRELFYDYFILPYKYLLYIVLLSVLVNSFLLFNLNFAKYTHLFLGVIEIILTIYLYNHLNVLNCLLVIAPTTIFNFIYFKFKRVLNDNNLYNKMLNKLFCIIK